MVMAHLGGKMLVFQTAVPSLGIGKIKVGRENPNLYNTEKEATLRCPDDAFYKGFAAECSRVQIGVDIFTLGGTYMDMASLAAIPRYTSGEVSVCTSCLLISACLHVFASFFCTGNATMCEISRCSR
jgi:protein transport protein SEC24